MDRQDRPDWNNWTSSDSLQKNTKIDDLGMKIWKTQFGAAFGIACQPDSKKES